jgi:acetylornithine deacetylase/succinyl-diaminopimelate desuccinylase-like protein
MATEKTQLAAAYLKTHFPDFLEDLKTLVRIPSVSFAGFPEADMKRSAQGVAALMKSRGLENVEILELPGVHPYVYGEHLKAPGKPTLLLYAHHDVQPVGRESLWKSPPFEPTSRPGPGGERLYGRGAADDKAGIVVHTSAIAAYLKAIGELPINVKVLIEGEEEIGSENLPTLLQKYKEKLQADVLVLTDTGNFDCGVPALTVGLRGLVALEVEVRALTKKVHSGMWGGPIPDPAMALSKMLASLVDDHGKINIPEIVKQVRPLTANETAEFEKMPFNESEFRQQAGMIDNARILHEGPSPLAQLWRLPSLTITAIQASMREQAGNVINDTAWAKVTVRLVPDMDPHQVAAALKSHLLRHTPWGLEVSFHGIDGSPSWMTDSEAPVFKAAEKALELGYGKKPYKVGCGGSIGFVQPFADALGGAPALLIGVEDPYSDAHGENESLLISDLEKACLSEIHLFSEIAKCLADSSGER